jgi:primary-amine oxidase
MGSTSCAALLPLTSVEIQTVSKIMNQHVGGKKPLHFKVITLEEPHRSEVLAFMTAHEQGLPTLHIERIGYACFYIRGTVRLLSSHQ